jgi:hypothetical protein
MFHNPEFQKIYTDHAGTWNLRPAIVYVSHNKGTGGYIKFAGFRGRKEHIIVVSGNMTYEEQKQTLLHEIAHAICWDLWKDRFHSKQFWAIAKILGVTRRYAPTTDYLKQKRALRYAWSLQAATR